MEIVPNDTPLTEKQEKARAKRLHKILDDADKKLRAEGVKFFVAAVDYKAPGGGKVFANADVDGGDMCAILDIAFPKPKDLINLGLWVGKLINARSGAKTAKLKDKK